MTVGIILARSALDDVTITASSEASADLAVANVQNDQPSEPWRSDGAATQTWTWDFGAGGQPCDTIALWPTNMGLNDTVTLELADDSGYSQNLVSHSWPGRYPMLGLGEQPLDFGPLGGTGDGNVYQAPFVVERFGLVVRRYGRLTFNVGAAPVEVGCAMLGRAWQPTNNFDWGLSMSWVDPSQIVKARGGQSRVNALSKYRAGEVKWGWLDILGAKAYSDIIYSVGKSGRVLFVPYPDSLHTTYGRMQCVLGRIVDNGGPARHRGNRYIAGMKIEELL